MVLNIEGNDYSGITDFRQNDDLSITFMCGEDLYSYLRELNATEITMIGGMWPTATFRHNKRSIDIDSEGDRYEQYSLISMIINVHPNDRYLITLHPVDKKNNRERI